MSLFDTPSAPQEDPAVKAERDRQQRQAENLLTGEIQTDLQRRTRSRIQRFGLAPIPSDFSPSNSLAAVRTAIASSSSRFGMGRVPSQTG